MQSTFYPHTENIEDVTIKLVIFRPAEFAHCLYQLTETNELTFVIVVIMLYNELEYLISPNALQLRIHNQRWTQYLKLLSLTDRAQNLTKVKNEMPSPD